MCLIETFIVSPDLRMENKCFFGPVEPNPKHDHRLRPAGWISALRILCHSGPVPGTEYTDLDFYLNPENIRIRKLYWSWRKLLKTYLLILICSPKHQPVLVSGYLFNPLLQEINCMCVFPHYFFGHWLISR